ncbi:MAG TPA: diguanylate cyclase, partial [Fimbriimonadaceae bacterium]|nr:diguanylate cyclase [Fimbriimonadaceae bacterium]
LALMRKLTHPDDWPVALKHFADIEHSNTDDVREFEQRLKNKDGEWRWVLFRQTVLERRADGTARITRGTGQDITERKGGEDAVRQAKEMLDRVIDRAGVGMALLATDGRILRVNEALSEFLGYSCDELLQLDFQSITHPEDLELDVTQFNQVLEGSIKSYTMEKRYFRKDGAVVWGTLSVTLLREADGSPLYFLGQVIDITERKSHEELANEYARLLEFKTLELDTANRQLQHMVSVDPLTEVFNRRMLEIRLGDAFELARRFSKPLALIMLDVDHFKKYNDDHGHVAGDEALCAVAKIIRGACRGGDVVARYGGEEFVVVCPDTSVEDALGLAERLRIAIKECDLKPARITCSLGVSAIGPDSREPQDIVEMADHALYQAKAGGRDRVCSFLGPLESPAIARPA